MSLKIEQVVNSRFLFLCNTIQSKEQLGWEAQTTIKSGINKLLSE